LAALLSHFFAAALKLKAMKHFLLAFGSVLLATSLTVSAQQSAGLRYGEAVRAFQRGDSEAVVRLLEPVARSEELKGAELGRVWLLLGASYRAVADYNAARRAYHNSMSLLKDDPNARKQYAVVLRESGGLDRELGDFDSSERLEKESLQLSEQNHDHAAIARACEGLAELSFDRGKLKQGEQFISRAEDEARLTNDFDGDDRAYLAQLRGWLALKTGNAQSAIDDYQQAIDLFTGRYGDKFVLSGWGYILLGNAYDQNGSRDQATDAMRNGMAILEHTAGTHHPWYAVAEIRYAKLLRETGQHSLAAQMKRQGEATLRDIQQTACAGCAMDVAAFR
jgi:tetratricopeptide (TPR) repeat protein